MDDNVILSRGECEIAMVISFVKNENELSISNLVEKTGLSIHNPLFYNVLKALYEVKAVEVKKEIGPTKFIKIYHKNLRKFLWEQKNMQKYIEYFKRNHILIYS